MVRKKQANLERFAGNVAKLVGGKPLKNKTGQKIGKPRFQLDRKMERKLKKDAKKAKKIKHVLLKAGAELPEHHIEPAESNKKAGRMVSKKSNQVDPKNKNSKDMTSLQSQLKNIYDQHTGSSVMSKEEAAVANKQEDRLIKHLGKRLGFSEKATGNVPKSLDVDGLGYVLHFKDECDDTSKQETMAESATNELFDALGSEDCDFQDGFEDEVSIDEIMSNEDVCNSSQDMTDNEQLDEILDDSVYHIKEENLTDKILNKDIYLSCDKQIKTSSTLVNKVSEETKSAKVAPVAYVPPHIRNMEKNEILKRKIRGYVNRVSTSNFKQILSDIELVYQEHPRGEVNKAILSAVTDSCLINTIMPARLCAEHMLLIAGLSSTIGAEFVSPMLEDLAEKFTNEMTERHGKLLNNIVSMICFLYALKVVSCILIFDIIKTLLQSFTEADLEVLLYIFKSVGLDIRKDDPQALKDIVQIVNESVGKVKDKSSRFVWFVDTLTAVKNNNVNKIPNYDKSDIIDIQRAYKAIVKIPPSNLQLKLTDLLDAKTKGRWWLVGAAWTGLEDTKKSVAIEFDSKLLVLAKKNHMNNDVRKNIFCILMSSQDYEHCYEQIMKLNLKDRQEREIIHVTVLCALKCKTFNPYYTNVIKKFCGLSKNFQITTQFSIWDRLKELDSLASNKARNLSNLLSSLICSKTLSLSVLKVVNFTEIGINDVEFFKELFRKLLNESEILITEIFGRLQPLPLESLKNGIKVFMKHFLKPQLTATEQKNMKIACKCF